MQANEGRKNAKEALEDERMEVEAWTQNALVILKWGMQGDNLVMTEFEISQPIQNHEPQFRI